MSDRKGAVREFHFVDMDDPNRYKRLKVLRACDFCRKRKVKLVSVRQHRLLRSHMADHTANRNMYHSYVGVTYHSQIREPVRTVKELGCRARFHRFVERSLSRSRG
jgi:hypothetical protein